MLYYSIVGTKSRTSMRHTVDDRKARGFKAKINFVSILAAAVTWCGYTSTFVSASCHCQDHKGDFNYISRCDCNSYNDRCNVGDVTRSSCQCDSGTIYNNNNPAYFYCTDDCDDYDYRVDGECVQCKAGFFFGVVSNSSNKPSNCDNNGTSCVQQQPSGKWYQFQYVWSGDATQVGVSYSSDNPCSECPAGTYADQGTPVCKACGANTYSNASQSKCTPCPSGSIPYNTSTGCFYCPAGSYLNSTGSCHLCDQGYYSGVGETNCTVCSPGTYAPNTNTSNCTPASPGFYATSEDKNVPSWPGIIQQYPCPYGSYSEAPGSSVCTSCPLGKTTQSQGSTSSSDCVECPFGVNPTNYSCLTGNTNPLNDVCWNAAQLLSLNSSVAVQDLLTLMIQQPAVGIQSLITSNIDAIQQAAQSATNSSAIAALADTVQEAAVNWLNATYANMSTCQQGYRSQFDQTGVQSLVSYQFGAKNASRMDWLSYWHCSGATFGCAGNSVQACPQATTCFARLYEVFAPLLYAPGGATPFRSNQPSPIGRYTPQYSPNFIASRLTDTVNALTSWTSTAERFGAFVTIINQIQQSAATTQTFIITAANATLQLDAASTSASLIESFILGNLYWSQANFNFNKTRDAAEVVQQGPQYCDDNGCTSFEQLVADCEREMLFVAVFKLIVLEFQVAGAFVNPTKAKGKGTSYTKSVLAIASPIYQAGKLEHVSAGIINGVNQWDPYTSMPPLLLPNATLTADQLNYVSASYSWYVNATKNLSDSLLTFSSAFWDSLYLQSVDNVEPLIKFPPNCRQKKKIVNALDSYLVDVKNFTNYGNAMTTALMALVPVLGSIASGLSTMQAINQASQQISALVTPPPPPTIATAPTIPFQKVYDTVERANYANATRFVLGYGPALSLLSQQYLASSTIWCFCTSYSYMNAGEQFLQGNANCPAFGTNYIPTTESFNAVVHALAQNDFSLITAPSAVNTLSQNIVAFSQTVQSNPDALGETQGSYTDSQVLSFTVNLEPSINNASSSIFYYGDVAGGSVRFRLTAPSDLMLSSRTPFSVEDANPRVINVQAYWRGVTTNIVKNLLKTNINVDGPYEVYTEGTGQAQPYQLPPFQSDHTPSFAVSNTVQVASGFTCENDQGKEFVTWLNNEKTLFCTNQGTPSQPFPGLADSAFLFPSLWGTWNITASQDLWNGPFFQKNTSNLALAVVFQYVKSPTKSQAEVFQCFNNCVIMRSNNKWKTNPLLGQQWCDQPSCSDCEISQMPNSTDGFCLCDVWTGITQECPASSGWNDVTTPSFTITTTYGPNGPSSRRLRKSIESTTHRVCASVANAVVFSLTKACDSTYVEALNVQKCVSTDPKMYQLTFTAPGVVYHYNNSYSAKSDDKQWNQCAKSLLKSTSFLKSLAEDVGACQISIGSNTKKLLATFKRKSCRHSGN